MLPDRNFQLPLAGRYRHIERLFLFRQHDRVIGAVVVRNAADLDRIAAGRAQPAAEAASASIPAVLTMALRRIRPHSYL
jgi:hypothetical protein